MNGFIQLYDFTVYYIGHDSNRRNGVAVIVWKRFANTLESSRRTGIVSYSSAFVRKHSSLQFYESKDGIERFYAKIQEALQQAPKHDIYIIGDFNVKVDRQEQPGIVKMFGLGYREDAGDRYLEFFPGESV